MGSIGFPELVMILAILILIFGASRLPQVGAGIGQAIRNFKRGLSTDEDVKIAPKERQVGDKSAREQVEEAEIENQKK